MKKFKKNQRNIYKDRLIRKFMKRGKKMLAGFFLASLVMFSISFVYAGWFGDLFKFGKNDAELEGELEAAKPATVQLQVSGAYPAPQIVWISDIAGKSKSAVVAADRDLTGGADTSKVFDVYAYSSAGTGALPVSPTTAQVYVTLVYTGGTPAQPNGENSRKSTAICTNQGDDVAYNTNADDLTDINIGTVAVRKYRCTVAIKFYDNYGLDPGNWDVRAYIQDIQGHPDGWDGTQDVNCGPTSVPATCTVAATHLIPVRKTYFNKNSAWDLNPATADYGTVGFSDDLNKMPTTNPKVLNNGNIDIDTVTIKAQDVPKTGAPADPGILSSWFLAGPSVATGSCTAGAAVLALADNVAIDSNIVSIAYGPAVSSDLKICLDKIAAPVTIGSFSTASPCPTVPCPWDIDVTYCTNPGCT